MEEGKRGNKKQKFFVIAIGIFLVALICSAPWWGCRVFCYDSKIAHPNIAQLAALLYNKTYPDKKLTVEEINWIMIGSEEEDTPTRWLNHFYDPIHNVGLVFETQHLSAKVWAVNPQEQTNFAMGDQSWPRAISDYNKGDREDAYKELGHVLHLIADMSVPAHTRADIHVMPGDSYETYVRLNWNNIQKQISSQFIGVFSLNQAFDEVANYSNNNFYSDDTIEDKNFSLPEVSGIFKNKTDDGVEFYKLNKNGEKNILINVSIEKSDGQSQINSVLYTNNSVVVPINNFVLSDYSLHLIPKAVGYSAGVIKLFFSEAEKNVAVDLPKDRVSVWGWGNTVLGWGVSAVESAKNYLTDKFGGNNQAIGQAPATVTSETPPLNLPLKEGETATPTPTPSVPSVPPVKKVLGEKIVTPVVVVIPDQDPGSSGQNLDSRLRGNDSVAQGGGGSSSSGGGTSSSAAAGGTGADSSVASLPLNDSTSTTTTTSATTTPNEDPDFRQDDSVTTTTPDRDSSSSTPRNDPSSPAGYDGQGNTTTTPSGADPSAAPLDDNPPTIPTIKFDDAGFGLDYNLIITVTSTDASSSLVWFDLEYLSGVSSSTPSSTWQILVASSTDIIYHFTTEPGQKYIWRARARDRAGNISNWTSDILYVGKANWSKQVVINEVAWAGTAGFPLSDVNDKWLELYNNTDSPIDISGWKLYVGNNALFPVKITTTTIAAHGYYLLERSLGDTWSNNTSDDTVSDIHGDYVFYLNSSDFKITGERLRLVDAAGKIIDEVDCSNGWFTDNADGMYRTMERIDSRKSGNDPKNWQSSHGPRPLGRGRNGVTIYGSPRQPNFGNVVLAGDQLELSRTLTVVDNPYIAAAYVVPAGKTLAVESGVVIKSLYPIAPLRVAGRLEIKGTVESPVVITSGRDQTFTDPKLNTIVGVWAAGGAQARDWQGLWFDPGAVGEIAGLELRYAGYKFKAPHEDHWFGSSVEQSIRADHATLNINDSNILNNGNVALYLENSTTTIQNTKFNNGGSAINALDSAVTLENVTMSNFTVANGPINIVRSFPSFKNLKLENNQYNGVFLENPVFQGETTIGKELSWYMSYPTIPTGATLHLDPGAKILLPHQGIVEINGGRLLAEGTPDEPVEFAPFVGGDTWGILRFTNSDSVLNNVRMTSGNNATNKNEGIITATNSHLQFKNVAMNQLRGWYNIIKSENSNLDLENVNLGYDVKPGIETCAVDIKNGTLKLRSVSFKNLNYGLYAFPASLPDLDMDPLDLLDKFESVDIPMLPNYPWIKVPPAPLPEIPL